MIIRLDILNKGIDTDTLLDWMCKNGESVLLNWGEDDNLWECSWIIQGKRYTAFKKTAREAAREAVNKYIEKRQ